jgi:hypothetical protein
MTAWLAFWLGFAVATAIGLVTTTTPQQAAANLAGWTALLRSKAYLPKKDDEK